MKMIAASAAGWVAPEAARRRAATVEEIFFCRVLLS
jgi:hypothetical protein